MTIAHKAIGTYLIPSCHTLDQILTADFDNVQRRNVIQSRSIFALLFAIYFAKNIHQNRFMSKNMIATLPF